MIEVGNTQQVEFLVTGEEPLQRSSAASTKTLSACAARRAKYLASIKSALPAIQAARKTGAKNARQFAAYLNGNGVPSSTGNGWNESSVLRCLRKLKALKLDVGSRDPRSARGKFRASRPRRLKSLSLKAAATAVETASADVMRKLHGASLPSPNASGEGIQTSNYQKAEIDGDLKPQNSTNKNGRG